MAVYKSLLQGPFTLHSLYLDCLFTAQVSDVHAILTEWAEAPPSQRKECYRNLTLRTHPDKGGDPVVMTRLNHARDVLLQPEMAAIPC